MARLHLALEIDSDLYPELYAKLASLDRLGDREEKLRQLAALGLVWELARLHGPALWDLSPGLAAAAAPPGRADDDALAGAVRDVPFDDVDLALGADPLAPPPELPVLLDVVTPAEAGMGGAASEQTGSTAASANDDSPPPRVKSTRSARLARMKERGLFQNG